MNAVVKSEGEARDSSRLLVKRRDLRLLLSILSKKIVDNSFGNFGVLSMVSVFLVKDTDKLVDRILG